MGKILQKKFESFDLTFENIIRGIRMQYILAVAILFGNKVSFFAKQSAKWMSLF